MSEDDLRPEDVRAAIELAKNAKQETLDLREEIADLEEQIERQQFRLGKFQVVIDALDEDPYENLDYDEKVAHIRNELIERAERSRSGAKRFDYEDIQDLWGGRPSPGHAYDLLEDAAAHPAFEELSNPRRIAIDLDATDLASLANDEDLVIPANNDATGEGGRE